MGLDLWGPWGWICGVSVPMDLWGPWGWIYGARGVESLGSVRICGAHGVGSMG